MEEREQLALTTKLTEKQIRGWFGQERQRMKLAAGGTIARVERLSKEAVDKLKKWYEEHESHPYPTMEEREQLALTTKLSEKQIRGWFGQKRQRMKLTAGGKIASMDRLSIEPVNYLKKWYEEHESHPYPSTEEMAELMITTKLMKKQIKGWFGYERGKRKKVAGGTTSPVERLSAKAVEKLRKWYDQHESHPYPTTEEKKQLELTTKLMEKQVNYWFHNERVRRKKAIR